MDELTIARDRIEAMIDAMGVDSFLSLVETVCAEKSEHIQDNWQDFELSRRWARVARRVDAASLEAIGL